MSNTIRVLMITGEGIAALMQSAIDTFKATGMEVPQGQVPETFIDGLYDLGIVVGEGTARIVSPEERAALDSGATTTEELLAGGSNDKGNKDALN